MRINNELNINAFFPKKAQTPESAKIIRETLNSEDNLDISSDGTNLHKLAMKSNEILSSIDNIRENEIQKIKSKLENGYYKRDDVINQVASSIMEEDEFQKLFLNNETLDTIKGYIDLKESDLEKVADSKAKVSKNAYNRPEVLDKVADEIIDIYS